MKHLSSILIFSLFSFLLIGQGIPPNMIECSPYVGGVLVSRDQFINEGITSYIYRHSTIDSLVRIDPYIVSSDTLGFIQTIGVDTTTVVINPCAGESLSMSNLENLSDAGATQGNTINLTNVGINTSNPEFSLDVSGVDGIRVPCGTTAQRPFAPKKGVIRFNTSSNKFEGFNGTKWVKLSLF